MRATWTPDLGDAVFYVRPAHAEVTDQPYGAGTRRTRRPVRIDRRERRDLAVILEINADGRVLIQIEGGGRVLADLADLLPWSA